MKKVDMCVLHLCKNLSTKVNGVERGTVVNFSQNIMFIIILRLLGLFMALEKKKFINFKTKFVKTFLNLYIIVLIDI